MVPTFDALGESASLSPAFDVVVPFRLNFAHIGWMGQFNYSVVARLAAGVTLEQARAEMNVIQRAVTDIAARETHEPADLRGWVVPLDEAIVGRARARLLLLLGAIGAVMLIACANLANLSLTRALGRVRDAAVRSALGASRARLVRGVVLEQCLLAATGGAFGLLVARQALALFAKTAPVDLPRVHDVVMDARVLAFAAALAVVAGLLVALLPAWRIGRGDVQATLRGGGHGATDRGGLRVRATLLAFQVALSVTLLVVTTLFVTSFVRCCASIPGSPPTSVVAVEIAPVASRYPDEKARAALYDRILDRTRRAPGHHVGGLDVRGSAHRRNVGGCDRPSRHTRRPRRCRAQIIDSSAPTTSARCRCRSRRGAAIDERDRNGRDGSGRHLGARCARRCGRAKTRSAVTSRAAIPAEHFQVVGIVADGRPTALEAESPLMVYVPYWFNNEGKSVLVVRTAGNAAAIAGERAARHSRCRS